MAEEFLQLTRMASELMFYCHVKGAKTLEMTLHLHHPMAELNVRAPDLLLSSKDVAAIHESTQRPRREEIGEYYGPLAGSDHDGTELNLVALMADGIEVKTSQEEGTSFIVKRRQR